MPEAVRKEALREFDRLARMPVAAAEYTVSRTYMDWLVTLPWQKRTDEVIDLPKTKDILDADHSGLEKAKDRILEYLAVRKLNPDVKGPILCFAGPPGVGKTSLAKSIARSLGRKFVRVSLGGMRDEAEIRGHRRTYIGALPGTDHSGAASRRVAKPGLHPRRDRQARRRLPRRSRVGTPRGARSRAEQLIPRSLPRRARSISPRCCSSRLPTCCTRFRPRSATAWRCSKFPGYTEEEKLAIARDHLVQKQISNHGLTSEQLVITDDALRTVIRGYTREAGVRNLEREIGALCRKAARRRAEGDETALTIDPTVVMDMLGAPTFLDEEIEERTKDPGVAIGLAWTPAGGDVLLVEASRMAGTGTLTLTGQLGDVMKESARAALSWFRAHAAAYGADPDFFKNAEIHLHVPSGAIPKDGPSAGVTIATSLASELTRRPVRGDIAMTGEVTLSGRVLPVGGIKEKVLAARRVGIREVILPRQNEKNVKEDLSEELKRDLTIHYVQTVDEVLLLALTPAAKTRSDRKTSRKVQASLQ